MKEIKISTLILVLPFSLVPFFWMFFGKGLPLSVAFAMFGYFWFGFLFGHEVRDKET